jgi:FMN-dependent NADH-azoreductase
VPTLLQIIATPHQNGNSQTRQLADSFLQGWETVNPTGVVETLDLSEFDLPPLDEPMVAVLFDLPSAWPPELLAKRRRALDKLVTQFISADVYLFVTPMWNFGLPYLLKHYFDLVIRPGWTFALGEQGTTGILGGRPAYAVITRGFDYSPESGKAQYNHLEPHLRTLLGFMGIEDLSIVAAEGMMLPEAEARMEAARKAATAMGLGLVAA